MADNNLLNTKYVTYLQKMFVIALYSDISSQNINNRILM